MPGMQTLSNVTGSGAAGVTREMGGSPNAQLAAGLLGGVGAPAAVASSAATVRGLTRGGEVGRQAMQGRIDDFRVAGTTPTVGQASNNPVARWTETVLGRLPGGATVIANKAARQGEEIGAGVRRVGDDLATGADPTTAGRAIKEGIVGPVGFKQTQADISGRLYGALDSQIPAHTRIGVQNTKDALGQLNPELPGMPAMTPMFQNGRIEGIKSTFALDSAPAPGGLPGITGPRLPYVGVQKLRTQVGKEIDNSFGTDVPTGDWKQLYKGLSKDMEGAAAAQGPAAQSAFARANKHYNAVGKRSEAIEHVVNQDTPEAIYTAAMQGTDKGATTLNALMKSLPAKATREVAAAVLDRMGRATKGQQNADGTAFSTSTFLTNWNGLSPRARAVLFDRFGPEFRERVNAITRVADNLKNGSRVYANPSGTSGATAQNVGYGALGVGAGAAIMGNPLPLAATVGGMAVNNGTARLMTNPDYVRWLARQTPAPYGVLAPSLLNVPRSGE